MNERGGGVVSEAQEESLNVSGGGECDKTDSQRSK